MSGDKALVTGGAGFIGSHLVDRLLENGVQVTVLDNLSTGKSVNVPSGAALVRGSTADADTYDDLSTDIDTVFHLAGQSSGEASFDDPEYDFESHTLGTFRLLRWCDNNDINRVLYASSMSIYGDPEYSLVDESHPSNPKTYYAAGKLAAEAYVSLFDNLGMDTTILRLFSVYGPGQDLQNMKQGMVSIYLTFLLDDEEILVKGPLDRFRDFVYVDDVIDAFVAAAAEPTTHGEIYNVARGTKVRVKQLLNTIIKCAGYDDYPVEVADRTPGDQFGIYGDSSKLQEDADWSPSVTLEEGLTRMIQSEADGQD